MAAILVATLPQDSGLRDVKILLTSGDGAFVLPSSEVTTFVLDENGVQYPPSARYGNVVAFSEVPRSPLWCVVSASGYDRRVVFLSSLTHQQAANLEASDGEMVRTWDFTSRDACEPVADFAEICFLEAETGLPVRAGRVSFRHNGRTVAEEAIDTSLLLPRDIVRPLSFDVEVPGFCRVVHEWAGETHVQLSLRRPKGPFFTVDAPAGSNYFGSQYAESGQSDVWMPTLDGGGNGQLCSTGSTGLVRAWAWNGKQKYDSSWQEFSNLNDGALTVMTRRCIALVIAPTIWKREVFLKVKDQRNRVMTSGAYHLDVPTRILLPPGAYLIDFPGGEFANVSLIATEDSRIELAARQQSAK